MAMNYFFLDFADDGVFFVDVAGVVVVDAVILLFKEIPMRRFDAARSCLACSNFKVPVLLVCSSRSFRFRISSLIGANVSMTLLVSLCWLIFLLAFQ
jgi:hypothetical protein